MIVSLGVVSLAPLVTVKCGLGLLDQLATAGTPPKEKL